MDNLAAAPAPVENVDRTVPAGISVPAKKGGKDECADQGERFHAKSASSVTSQLISLRYIPGSVPFADTSRVWMDFFVRVTVR